MISFIVGTNNRPEELKRFIEHLKYQTSQDYEVIVADEGNNEWVKELGVKYYHQEYKGDWHYTAKNEASKLSTGDYLAFPQDDAVYYPQFVELMQRGDMCICGWSGNPPIKKTCHVDIGGFTVRRDKFTGFNSHGTADGEFVENFIGDVILINQNLYDKR